MCSVLINPAAAKELDPVVEESVDRLFSGERLEFSSVFRVDGVGRADLVAAINSNLDYINGITGGRILLSFERAEVDPSQGRDTIRSMFSPSSGAEIEGYLFLQLAEPLDSYANCPNFISPLALKNLSNPETLGEMFRFAPEIEIGPILLRANEKFHELRNNPPAKPGCEK